MNARVGLPLIGILALGACAPHSSFPDGAVILDEQVALTRVAAVDTATRELTIDHDVILVAQVDENLTDVHLKLAAVGSHAVKPVEVENNMSGAGVEIAVLEVPEDTRVSLTLTGPQNSSKPGAVHLRVRQFQRKPPSRGAGIAAQLAGYQAWSSGTNYSYRPPEILASGVKDLERAAASFAGPGGDARLAAEALLTKANVLVAYNIDMRMSYETALRAVAAFEALGDSATVPTARARLVLANVLSELALNPKAIDPTAEQAAEQAERMALELSGEKSPLGPIERARALEVVASLSVALTHLDEGRRYYEAARVLYEQQGHVAGETEMLANVAQVYLEAGEWEPAAEGYRRILPDVQKIANPVHRVKALLNAGHAVGRTNDPDQGMKLLIDAIALAPDYKLTATEAEASWELAWLYLFRGDDLQAKAMFTQALRIARSFDNDYGLSPNLQTAGMMARREGDYASAIALHQEAIPTANTPFHRIRALRELGLDYVATGDYPAAIAQFRTALAVKVSDPRHHIFTDIKRDLAEVLMEHGDGSRATLAEAERLLADSMQMSDKMHDARNQIGGHRVNARLQMVKGRYAASRAEYERCFDLIFKYRQASANPQLRMDALEQEQAAFRGYFDLMMRGVATGKPGVPQVASADAQDALRMLEHSRETRFGMPRSVSLDAATQARIDALLAQMADRSLKISRLLEQKLDAQQTAELDGLQLELARLRVEVDRERTVAAESHATSEQPAAEVARPWREVAPRTVQLSYALGLERAYVWIRDADGLRVAILSETPETIERELTMLAGLDAQRAPASIEQSLAAMSRVLLPSGLVPPDSDALDIVAEGRIASVPFAGLTSPVDPGRRLVETHALTVITSMYAAPEMQTPQQPQARPFRLVALASGGGTLRSARIADPMPKLQAATAEISAIAAQFEARDRGARVKLFAGSDGDANTLRTLWSSGADVVHFATHALADLRQPMASLLVLPAKDAKGAPAYLTAGQVQEWRGDVGLVFLSACESAIGPPRFAGGMPGLQSAFLRAGAHGVIATLWPIEDVLAREFTADFYQRFTGGQTAVQALNATQRAWLAPDPSLPDAEYRRRRITALAHGYYTE
jgi:tetratricopeptide (TPR) repeat protein